MSEAPPQRGSSDRIAPGFWRRLAYYLIGIAIGLMLLGFFQQMRSGAYQRQMARPGEAGGAADAGESPTRTPSEQPAVADD